MVSKKERSGFAHNILVLSPRNKTDTILCLLDSILEKTYKTPDLGNKVDPLEELLFLLIAQRTRIDLARKIFEKFKKEFYPWHQVFIPSAQDKLRHILNVGGRGKLRFRSVSEVLAKINQLTGKTSLEFLRDYSFEEAEKLLLSLPWVGKKTAYCVLMYSLGYHVFPVDSNIIRIFKRTKILKPFDVSLKNIDHRTAQDRISPLIPKDMVYTLHVNLVAHGKKICLPRRPKCNICPIKLFCEEYRNSEYKKSLDFKKTMVDLFCGSGGMSYGFSKAGIRPILALDNYEPACKTYSLNIPWIKENKIANLDITKIKKNEIKKLVNHQRVDLLVAGVPCKGFSRVGLKSKPLLKKKRPPEKEKVNRLFMEVIKWSKKLKPKFVLMENVPDMANTSLLFEGSEESVKDIMKRKFSEFGYYLKAIRLNSSDFGIPEARRRLFFIATQNRKAVENFEENFLSFWKEINIATETNQDSRLVVALKGLLPIEPKGGANINATHNYPKYSTFETLYEKFVYDFPYVTYNHVARSHNVDDLAIISALEQGETYRSLVLRKPEVIENRKRKIYSIENFHDKFYRLSPEKPCRTIVSHLSKDGNSFIHPFENRSITVREAARIQSFPDSFIFSGSRTSQFIQVGNAVPPLLAYVLALFLSKLIETGGFDGQ